MPTYRNGYKNKNDGISLSGNNVFRFEQYNHEKFINFLKENNILFLFKLHPYEEKLYTDIIGWCYVHWKCTSFKSPNFREPGC